MFRPASCTKKTYISTSTQSTASSSAYLVSYACIARSRSASTSFTAFALHNPPPLGCPEMRFTWSAKVASPCLDTASPCRPDPTSPPQPQQARRTHTRPLSGRLLIRVLVCHHVVEEGLDQRLSRARHRVLHLLEAPHSIVAVHDALPCRIHSTHRPQSPQSTK